MNQLHTGIHNIEKALNQGQVFLAHNIASELLLEFPDNLRLSQLKVIALNRLGQPEKAIDIILSSVENGNKDGETMGLLGRTYKDLYKSSGNSGYLRKSADAYYIGYLHSQEYYPAINAASLFLMLENRTKAHQMAKEVIARIGSPIDYWSTATLGEAWLILGNIKEAISYYDKAIHNNSRQFGKFQSTFQQLQFLSDVIQVPEELLQLFPKPKIAVFSGHMIDRPDRVDKRFPPEIEPLVREKLKQKVESLGIDIGFTSLASGSDIIFMEILKERNAEIKAYLPFKKDDFLTTSVANAGLGWINRFENCYDCAPKELTSESYLDTPDLFKHLGEVMMGECMLFSEQYGTTPSYITVLAPNQISAPGGTRDLLDFWPYADTHHNIDPTRFLTSPVITPHYEIKDDQDAQPSNEVERKITNILFADIVGFSKLLMKDTPEILLRLLTETRKLIDPFMDKAEVINTWGDAIILCHPEVEAVMQIASILQGVFIGDQAIDLGLPEGLNIRIALHKGPVFFAPDPLTREPNVYGSSINRTARMEPVTLPGAIYASDQFAASLKLGTLDMYRYQHVGIIELPKGFGRQEVYQISNKI
jgi:class 3 adenylate cyclase/tetratricopeptide (TPR) repeat protein